MFTNGNDSFVDPLGLSSNLSALDGNDTVNAQDGDDTVFGGNGADSLRGGDGLDLLYGDANNDRLLGGNGNDQLFGGSGNDTLNGEANNDTLDGGTGADSMNGGAGNDLIISADGQDTIVTGTGSDTVEYSLSATPRTVTITNFDPAVDKFVLRGEYQPFTVSDTGPPTTVTFANGDVVVFTTIAPTQFAPAYDVVYGNVDVTLITGDSPDLVTLGAAPLGQYVYTMGGNDTVVSAGSPTFVFDLGAGNDSLTVTGLLGGVGGGQLIDMGDGNDTVSLQDVDTVATISLGEGANSLTMKDFGPSYGGNSQSILAGTGNDTIKAGAFNDMYLADLGGDNIITLGDQGKIYAGAWLETGAGNDVLTVGSIVAAKVIMGDGNNTFTSGPAAYIDYYGGTGFDKVTTSAVDALVTLGSGGSTVSLSTPMNSVYIQAEAGVDNVTIGGSQSFGVSLGADNDSLIVTGLLGGVGGGQLIDMGEGNDTVSLQDVDAVATISLGEGANSLTMKDFGPSYGGNSQSILAGTGNDTIKVGAFNDMYLADLGGDNIITLGDQGKIYAGAWLETGAGNDVLTVGSIVAAKVIMGDGNNTFTSGPAGQIDYTGGTGFDKVTTSAVDALVTLGSGGSTVSLSTPMNSVYVQAEAGVDNVTIGGSQSFGVSLGADNDSLTVTGLLGGIGGGQLIDMGDGSDTVSLQDVDAVVTISLGEGANSLTMKDFGPSYGGNSQSILAGTGNDTIKAGAFNDMYLADLGGDNIITLGNQTAYYTGAWLETGAGNDSMTVGDFGAIRFILGDGANQLNAGNGYAEVFAGSGNDTINLGDGPHVITTGAGNDSVSTGSGASSIDTGLGNDTISAGAGNDTLFGGADADVLTGGSGADVFIYDILAGGLDRVTDYEVGVDVIQIGGFDPALWGTDGLGNGTYTPSVGNVLTVVGIIDATQITWA